MFRVLRLFLGSSPRSVDRDEICVTDVSATKYFMTRGAFARKERCLPHVGK